MFHPFLAQVPPPFGASVTLGEGPAPVENVGARFLAQVPTLFSHLRQKTLLPAPDYPHTCATGAAPPHRPCVARLGRVHLFNPSFMRTFTNPGTLTTVVDYE